jgi:hypothetical protein
MKKLLLLLIAFLVSGCCQNGIQQDNPVDNPNAQTQYTTSFEGRYATKVTDVPFLDVDYTNGSATVASLGGNFVPAKETDHDFGTIDWNLNLFDTAPYKTTWRNGQVTYSIARFCYVIYEYDSVADELVGNSVTGAIPEEYKYDPDINVYMMKDEPSVYNENTTGLFTDFFYSEDGPINSNSLITYQNNKPFVPQGNYNNAHVYYKSIAGDYYMSWYGYRISEMPTDGGNTDTNSDDDDVINDIRENDGVQIVE